MRCNKRPCEAVTRIEENTALRGALRLAVSSLRKMRNGEHVDIAALVTALETARLVGKAKTVAVRKTHAGS